MFAHRRSWLALPLLLSVACADPFIESTTVLGSTIDTDGPYEVRTVVIGNLESDRVELFYNSVDQEPEHYLRLVMEPLDADGRPAELFRGAIPGQAAGTVIRYFVAVERDGSQVAEDPVGGDLRPFTLTVRP